MTTNFSQRDPSWSKILLGPGPYTIGEAGCLMTAVTSCLCDSGVQMRPPELNSWLLQHGGYQRKGNFVWRSVEQLGLGLLQFVHCETIPAPMGVIESHLALGEYVLAEVDSKPGGEINQHWVRVLSVKHDKRLDCTIMDPWQRPGYEAISLLSKYGSRNWDAARAIFEIAVYGKVDIARGATEKQEVGATLADECQTDLALRGGTHVR
jgi:hypothetical protein